MSVDELSSKYLSLRSALASAYGQPVWDSGHIDRLTDEIADTEFALAASAPLAGIHLLRPCPLGAALAHR